MEIINIDPEQIPLIRSLHKADTQRELSEKDAIIALLAASRLRKCEKCMLNFDDPGEGCLPLVEDYKPITGKPNTYSVTFRRRTE